MRLLLSALSRRPSPVDVVFSLILAGRPIVSPFHTEGLVFVTSSAVFNLLAAPESPLEKLDFDFLFPNFCDLERNQISAWESRRSG